MKAYKCDRCEEYENDEPEVTIKHIGIYSTETVVELCSKCAGEFEIFLKGGPQNQ